MSEPTNKPKKAFCFQCGRPVRMEFRDGQWRYGHCQIHEWAKRMPEGFIERAFASLREAVEVAPGFRKARRA